MSSMCRLISYEPRTPWTSPSVSETTLSCQKFHTSRIQVANKLQDKLSHLRHQLSSSNFLDDSTEKKLVKLLSDVNKLAASDVKLAGQLERISDGADKIRHQYQRYQTWSTSGGLSPNVETDSDGMGLSLEDVRIASATLPRTADATSMLSPRFTHYHKKMESGSKGSVFTASSFSSSSSLPSPFDKEPNHYLDHTSTNAESKQTATDMKTAPTSIDPRKTINPPEDCSMSGLCLPRKDEVFTKNPGKNVGRRYGEAIKMAKNDIVNKAAPWNKTNGVKIYVTDYDNKPFNEQKSYENSVSMPRPKEENQVDLRLEGLRTGTNKTRQTAQQKPQRAIRENSTTAGWKEKEIQMLLSDKISKNNPEEQSPNNAFRTDHKSVKSNKVEIDSNVTRTKNASEKMLETSEVQNIAERSVESSSLKIKSRNEPPRVPVKKLNLLLIKRTSTSKKE